MERTLSTVAVHDGLVIAPTWEGYVHCLDARTGQSYWSHNTHATILGSPLIVGGKVYLTDDGGEVLIFALAREKRLLGVRPTESAVFESSPVYANGVLYVVSRDTLYAIGGKP